MSKTYIVTKDELKAELIKLMREGVDLNPIGTIISFMGKQPPATYLPCDGHQYVIEDYQELAEFITVQFGAVNYFGGDGERYFAVPSLGGEFLRGAGANVYENQGNGADVGVHQNGTMHTGNMFDIITGASCVPYNGGTGSDWVFPQNVDKNLRTSTGTAWSNKSSYSTTGGGVVSFTSRPTNTSVLFCIKAKTGDEQ